MSTAAATIEAAADALLRIVVKGEPMWIAAANPDCRRSLTAYQPMPVASAHSLGLARRNHAMRSFRVSNASIRPYATFEDGKSASSASLREASSASSSIVSSGAVTTMRRRSSPVAFSADRRRASDVSHLAASMASIQGHKAMASTIGSPVVSRARGIDPIQTHWQHDPLRITARDGIGVVTCNVITTQDPSPVVDHEEPSLGIVIAAAKTSKRGQP